MQRPNLQRQNAFREPSFELPRRTPGFEGHDAPSPLKISTGELPAGYLDITHSLESKGLRSPGEPGAVGVVGGEQADAIITALFDYPGDRAPLEILAGNDLQALLSLYTLMAQGLVDGARIFQQFTEHNSLSTDRLPHALMRVRLAEGVDLVERINELKAMGHDPDAPDSKGRTAASIAAIANRPDCLVALQGAGVDIGKADLRGKTALHHAIRHGAFSVCRMLLARHCESALVVNPVTGQTSRMQPAARFINQTDLSGRTALHYLAALPEALLARAPKVQVRSVIEQLMLAQGDLNLPDDKGHSPLHTLAKYGTRTHFEYLQAHLGNDVQRFELFMHSAAQRNTAMMKCVFDAASNDQKHWMLQQISLQDPRICETALNTLLPDFSLRDSRGRSIAQSACERIETLAARSGHQQGVALEVLGLTRLMAAGLTLSAEEGDRLTRTALNLESSGIPRGRVLGALRDAGVLDGAAGVIDEYLNQLVGILASSAQGHHSASDIAFMLLKHLTSAGLHLPSGLKSQVIDHARRVNAHGFIDHLRSLGLMPDHAQLLAAIDERALDRVQRLIAAGVNLLERDEAGLTALHRAVLVGDQPVIEALIKAGGPALMDAKDDSGKSAVVYAIRASRHDALLALGEHGADLFHNAEPALKVLTGEPDARLKHSFHAAALGLGTLPASLRDVTRAHHRLSLACHPDKHAHSSPEARELATAKMVLANNARDHFRAVLG